MIAIISPINVTSVMKPHTSPEESQFSIDARILVQDPLSGSSFRPGSRKYGKHDWRESEDPLFLHRVTRGNEETMNITN
ncbi:hypothetical protein DMENIID0001_105660 [Sergentomyia squamirostris]